MLVEKNQYVLPYPYLLSVHDIHSLSSFTISKTKNKKKGRHEKCTVLSYRPVIVPLLSRIHRKMTLPQHYRCRCHMQNYSMNLKSNLKGHFSFPAATSKQWLATPL